MGTDQKSTGSFREFRELVAEDFNTHERSFLRPGFQAIFMYRFGFWASRIRSKPLRLIPSILYKVMHVFIRNVYGIELYYTAKIGRRFRIAHQSGINIHHDAVIGDDCMVRQGVTLGNGPKPGAPQLGNRVRVGVGAIICGGVTIGDDVNIGPNAVVAMDVPANRIVTSPIPKILPAAPQE